MANDEAWDEWVAAIERRREAGLLQLQDLLPYLDSDDPRRRGHALIEIMELGDPAAGPYLYAHLAEPDDAVRCEVVEVLGWLRYRPAAPDLANVLLRDPDWLTRLCAAEALGELGVDSPAVVQALTTAVERDWASLVRSYAAEALGALGVRAALPVLQRQLAREQVTRTRAGICSGLSLLGDRHALVRLLRMVDRVRDVPPLFNILSYVAEGLPAEEWNASLTAVLGSTAASRAKHPRLLELLDEMQAEAAAAAAPPPGGQAVQPA